ncbi:MAG: glycosyltransferase family 1 protein [Prochloraceae cyanobacterium]|nr:glycosyltransferase family 1 protein [Prochloraceae cyanobacterium]
MSTPILINLSILFSKPTGIATYAINLIPYLKQLNPTLLIANKVDKFNCYQIPANLTPAQGTKAHLLRLLWTQLQLPRIYDKLQGSLLFSPVPEAPLYSNCRYVVTVHDLIPLRFPRPYSPLTNYYRYYVPQVLERAEHIICDSRATAKDITDFYGIPAKKIAPILLGYNSDHFRVLDTLDRSHTPPYFLYIGRQDPYKNLHRLIDAFATISKYDEYQLWLAGSFDRRYTPTLQAKVSELGLTQRIKFLDYIPYQQLPIVINRAIALVFPSLWEGFGIPVLEAMACGTPVITSNLSSLPEITGDAAILINPYCTEEIAAAMKAIAKDFHLRENLSQLGKERASQFSWTKTGRATAEVLEKYIV